MSTRRSRFQCFDGSPESRWLTIEARAREQTKQAQKSISVRWIIHALSYVNRANSTTTTRVKLQSFIEIKTDESRSAHTASQQSFDNVQWFPHSISHSLPLANELKLSLLLCHSTTYPIRHVSIHFAHWKWSLSSHYLAWLGSGDVCIFTS